eukprot:3625779-Pyramimonas_sp.AAC.1
MQRAQGLAVLSAISDFRASVVEPEANGTLRKSLKKGPPRGDCGGPAAGLSSEGHHGREGEEVPAAVAPHGPQ